MPRLSLIVITRDCADALKLCLQSVQGCVDEIVVVDSGSTDATLSVAESFKAKIVQQPWLGYGAQKNVALAHATGDWILWLDSDEYLSDGAGQEIRTAIDHGQAEAIAVRRRTHFLGRWLDHCLGAEWVVRVFRKTEACRFSDDHVHERLLWGSEHYRKCDVVIGHEPYASLSVYVQKFDRYGQLYARQHRGSGRKLNGPWLLAVAIARWVKLYILKRGFLDGVPGLIFCSMSAAHDFYKYACLWDALRREEKH